MHQLGVATSGNGAPKKKPAAGPEEDTVQVIRADGAVGTIPRANLAKALKKGYKLAHQ
ncbi:MAG: hypothetical protein ACRD3S_12615 [Terracidiphilus sp.]